MNQDQLNYVKGQLAGGVDEEQIRATLKQNQYSEELINQLLLAAKAAQSGVTNTVANANANANATNHSAAATSASSSVTAYEAANPLRADQTAAQTTVAPDTNAAVADQSMATQATSPATSATPTNTASVQPAAETKEKSGLKVWQIILMVIGGLAILAAVGFGVLVLLTLNGLTDAQEQGQDAALKSLISNQRVEAELYYDANGLSYAGFCNQSAALQNPNFQISCLDSETAYRLSSQLTDGTHYCVDATGFGEAVSTAPTGIICMPS